MVTSSPLAASRMASPEKGDEWTPPVALPVDVAAPKVMEDALHLAARQIGMNPGPVTPYSGKTKSAGPNGTTRPAGRRVDVEKAGGEGMFACCWRKRSVAGERPPPTSYRAATEAGVGSLPRPYRPTAPKDTPEAIDKQYQMIEQIGKGAYGKVYKAADMYTDELVAIKVVDGVFNSTTDAIRTLREVSILRQTDHRNVARCLSVLRPPDSSKRTFTHLWIVLELAETDLSVVRCPSCRALTVDYKPT